MYQFQISNQADIIMPLDLSAVFFVLIDQGMTNQKGLYQGVIPASVLGRALSQIEMHLEMLPHYHAFLKTEAGQQYTELRPLYLNDDRLQHLIPDDLKVFFAQIQTYRNTLARDYTEFYKFNNAPEVLLISLELKKRLFPIVDILKHGQADNESVMFQKL